NGLVSGERRSGRCAQRSSPSRDGDATSGRGPASQRRTASIHGGAERGGPRLLSDAACLLPGASRDEPEAVSVAAADELGTAGAANGGSGEDDCDRGRHQLRFLGIGALLGGLPLG